MSAGKSKNNEIKNLIIEELNNYPVDQLLSERHNKIQSYGEFEE